VGFLEYARNISLEKDPLKLKYLVTKSEEYPKFIRDGASFVAILPEPKVSADLISFLGYNFSGDSWGKQQVAKLFRASVFHMCGHVVSKPEDYEGWMSGRNTRVARFIGSLLEDVNVTSYMSITHQDKVIDLSFANALALKRMKRIHSVMIPATRIMMSLLVYGNTGLKTAVLEKDKSVVDGLIEDIDRFKEMVISTNVDKVTNLSTEKLEIADKMYGAIINHGPVVEIPSLPHVDHLESCSLFPPKVVSPGDILDKIFLECLRALGGESEKSQQTSTKAVESEALQIFDSWSLQREKEKKILGRYSEPLLITQFKSVGFPEQDYSEYLRIKTICRSETRRLISTLLVARDALDEDPQKPYGVLDLQDVIQVLASKSPRMDIFMLDEYIDKSYSWVILIDASRSMACMKDYTLEIAATLADTANELLLDTTTWSMYAFNDQLLVVKDGSESYNSSVKSRIGGIQFQGPTYIPDALQMAGHVLKGKVENMKLITVISDGWPYGYPNIHMKLNETIGTLEKLDVVLIGVGVKTKRMGSFFNSSLTANTLKDVSKRFSDLYLEASKNVY